MEGAVAYDELLAMQVRDAFGDLPGVSEKRMMGGVCFLLHGNMVCAADRTKAGVRRFMFRLGKDNPALAKLCGGEPMIMGDRQMPGFYFVEADRCAEAGFQDWMAAAITHASGLPRK
jgi:hypothetical protein